MAYKTREAVQTLRSDTTTSQNDIASQYLVSLTNYFFLCCSRVQVILLCSISILVQYVCLLLQMSCVSFTNFKIRPFFDVFGCESRKENPQKLTQFGPKFHPRHLVGKRQHKKTPS